MSTRALNYAVVRCDGCRATFETGGFVCWPDPTTARAEAGEAGWLRADGLDLCPTCRLAQRCDDCDAPLAAMNTTGRPAHCSGCAE